MYITFSIFKKHYLYSPDINKSIEIDEVLFNKLNKSLNLEEYYKFIKSNAIVPSEHVFYNDSLSAVGSNLQNKRSSLTLQVTQNCNLTCSYCPYYAKESNNRKHSLSNMPISIAQRAIDDLVEHSSLTDHLTLIFYGGEPLMNFSLIEHSVNYISNVVKDKSLYYNITTNGTLLTPHISDFFVRNKFNLTISLDGNKQIHDKNRTFKNGLGSYDIIIKNLEYIKNKYPDYWGKHVRINAVVSSMISLNQSIDFFNKSDLIDISMVSHNFAKMQQNIEGGKARVKKIIDSINETQFVRCFLLTFIKQYDESFEIASSFYKYNVEMDCFYGVQKERKKNQMVFYPKGQCISGVSKLLCDVNGEYWPCEKINEKCDFCKIGNVTSGIDVSRVINHLTIAETIKEECLKCWAMYLCKFCMANFCESDHINKTILLENCKKQKSTLETILKLCVAYESVIERINKNGF